MLINHLNNWKQSFRGIFQKGSLKKKKRQKFLKSTHGEVRFIKL